MKTLKVCGGMVLYLTAVLVQLSAQPPVAPVRDVVDEHYGGLGDG
ncbi:hypothetical protein ES703_60795 [subsurface metagenome]